jgi:hypothetical protein
LPGGVNFAVGLDAAVAPGGNQLGQHVGDFFGAPGVVTTLLALAACGEVGGVCIGGINGAVNGCVLDQFSLPGSSAWRADAKPQAALSIAG